MVGSTNGRGVDLSTNMGRLMATFDPRRLLMFAVKVLERHHTNPIIGKHAEEKQTSQGKAGGDPPKAHVGFNQDQITYAARVGRARSRLEHIPAILRMEHRGDDATWAQGRGKKRKGDISGRRSGNEDDERLR